MKIKSMYSVLVGGFALIFALGARGSMIAPDAELDVYRSIFQLHIDEAILLFDSQTSRPDFFENKMQVFSSIANNPNYKTQTLADCEAIKSQIVVSSPVNPFKVQQSGTYTLDTPFCERQSGFKKTEYGILNEATRTNLGMHATRVLIIQQSEPDFLDNGEIDRNGMTAYYLDHFDAIVAILTFNAISLATDDKFPSIDMRWTELTPSGGVYHLVFNKEGMMEQFYPADSRIPLVTRDSNPNLQSSDKPKVQTISAFRYDSFEWIAEALLLPVIHEHSQNSLGERQLSKDGMEYGYKPLATSRFFIKTLNKRELCSYGFQYMRSGTGAPGSNTRVSYPKTEADYNYCGDL